MRKTLRVWYREKVGRELGMGNGNWGKKMTREMARVSRFSPVEKGKKIGTPRRN
jgi:hypothetical protein